jgi:hypothetical protein
MRETQADWSSPTGTVSLFNTSVDLRPGALTQDYKAAFSYGPNQIADLASGSVDTVWRARVVSASLSTSIAISRGSGSDTTFSSEVTLFTFAHNNSGTISEVDLGFGSDGRAVVCAERVDDFGDSKIWLYWFNPFVNDFVFQQFQTGSRSPRIILDNPEDVANSDLLLFYINKSDGSLKYRQQRDQYGTEYSVATPLSLVISGGVSSNNFTFISGSNITLVGTGILEAVNANFSGTFVGSASYATTTGTSSMFVDPEQFSGIFTGSVFGEYTGVFSGTYDDGITITSGSALSGTFYGYMSGNFAYAVTNSVTGVVGRRRVGTFGPYTSSWGVHTGSISGSLLTGSFGPPPTNNLLFASINSGSGWSGSITGSGFVVEYNNGSYTGTPSTFNDTYLEDAVKLKDSRVAVFYSRRNSVTDQWANGRFESILYPFRQDADRVTTDVQFVTGNLRDVLLAYSQTGSLVTDVFVLDTGSINVYSASIRQILRDYFHTGVLVNDVFILNTSSINVYSASVTQKILTHSLLYTDSFISSSIALATGSFTTIVLEHTLFYVDNFVSSSIALVTGSLIVP